jgi:short subunit dehydrogenase-like uncharacterized protein
LWGKVVTADGKAMEGRVDVPEGYRFTRDSSLAVIERLQTLSLPGGTYTPSLAFGSQFVESIPGTTSIGIKSK